MASLNDNETGFSESDINFARRTFYRDCPNGYCSKRKFLTFLRKSCIQTSLQKSNRSSNLFVQTLINRQNYRQSRKFFSMMFDIYDQNHDGQLDFNEYIYALSALTGANRLRTIETLYNFFDIHNQGYITQQEFNSRKKLAAQFLGQYKTGINDNLSYEQAFKTMDTNDDGKISKDEFIHWHLQDHLMSDDIKPTKKRTRLLKNLSNLVDIRGQIKTSSLQQYDINKNPIDAWLETTMNVNNNNNNDNNNNNNNNIDFSLMTSSQVSNYADRYLLKVLRRARNRFIQHKHSSTDGPLNLNTISIDNQSDSGVFTLTSSRTNFNDDYESNSLLDIDNDDDDYLQSINTNDPDNELLCQSLEVALMETLIELRQLRSNSHYSNISNKDQILITRL